MRSLLRMQGAGPGRQRGATLVIALVMLMLMMVHALASFTAADVQLRNAQSMNARHDAQSAANLALAQTLGASVFVSDPALVAAAPLDVDIDGDGRTDYRVTVAATCGSVTPVHAATLSTASSDDAACLAAAAPDGVTPCVDAAWNLRASAAPGPGAQQTGVTVEVNQGARVRLDASDAARTCPGVPPANLAAAAATPVTLTKARRKTYWYLRAGV